MLRPEQKAPLRPVSKAQPDPRLSVTLTVAELAALMRNALVEALAEVAKPAMDPPRLNRGCFVVGTFCKLGGGHLVETV